MKSLGEINNYLIQFEKQFGFKVLGCEQGSATWMNMKLGVLSASNASQIVAKKDSETRLTYMAELAAQIATGTMEEINSKYLDWGNQHEDAARAQYEFITDRSMRRASFVFKDDLFREGFSPDGILDDRGVEIKTPFNPVHYVKFLCEEKLKPEYQWQNQFSMRVLGSDCWDACQYHPLMKKKPIKILPILRDSEMQKKLDDLVPEFILDLDKMLAKIGLKFGDQWSRLAEK